MGAETSAHGEAAPAVTEKAASRQSGGLELQAAELPVVLIPVDLIDVPTDRVRSLKVAQADAIGAAIIADGQYDPITVARTLGSDRFMLVDGLHRLEGCRLHEIRLIEARVVLANRDARLRQEVLSGVVRADHDVFDRAAQMAALAASARQKAGKPAIGDLRRLNGFLSISEIESEADADLAMIAKSMHWSETAAEIMGCSPRKVRQYAVLAERFTPEMIAVLREKGLASELVPLTRLAALPPFGLRQAIQQLAEGWAATIAEALANFEDKAEPTPFNKKFNRFMGWVDDVDTRERAQIIKELNEKYHANGRPKKATSVEAAK